MHMAPTVTPFLPIYGAVMAFSGDSRTFKACLRPIAIFHIRLLSLAALLRFTFGHNDYYIIYMEDKSMVRLTTIPLWFRRLRGTDGPLEPLIYSTLQIARAASHDRTHGYLSRSMGISWHKRTHRHAYSLSFFINN